MTFTVFVLVAKDESGKVNRIDTMGGDAMQCVSSSITVSWSSDNDTVLTTLAGVA